MIVMPETLNYVHRCLKMPHAKMVGYYQVGDDKVYCANRDLDDRFFDIEQKDLVEGNNELLTMENFTLLPRAVVNESELVIGDTLKCSVLNDGRRVIKDESLFNALDRKRKGELRIEGFPPIIGSKNLATF